MCRVIRSWLGPVLLLLAACEPVAKLPKDDAPVSPKSPPQDPLPAAERLLAEALKETDPAPRAAKLRSAAAELAKAESTSALALRAEIRAQQGLWEAAHRDASAAIAKGGPRRLRLRINADRLLESFFALTPRQDYAWLTEAQEDAELLGKDEPELAALGQIAATGVRVWDRIEHFDQAEVAQSVKEGLRAALDGLGEAGASPVLEARLAVHLAGLATEDSAALVTRAEAALAKANANRSETRRARMFHALAQGKREDARKEAMALAQFLPDSPEPLFILAQIQLGGGEKDEAMKTLERASSLSERPSDPALWHGLTRLGALSALSRSEAQPSDDDCLAALKDLREAAALDSKDAVPAFYIGIIHLQYLQNTKEGIEYLEKYNNEQPGTLLARNARLLVYSFKGALRGDSDAVYRFRRARYVTKELKRIDAGRQLYEMLLRQLEEDASTGRRLNEAIRANVEQVARYNLACIHAQQGRADESFQALEKAFEGGLRAFDQMRTDKDLESIRNDPRFEALIKKYEGK